MFILKRIFYFIISSAILLIFSNMASPVLKKYYSFNTFNSKLSEIKNMQNESIDTMKESNNMETQTVDTWGDQKPKNEKEITVYDYIETVKGKNGEKHDVIYNPNNGLYMIQNNNYVYLDGMYFPYNTKNRYEVNDVMVYFKPKPILTHLNLVKTEDHQEKSEGENEINTDITPGGMMNADNIKNVMSNVNKVQNNMRKRNEALKELMTE